jgi:hypothetical protein
MEPFSKRFSELKVKIDENLNSRHPEGSTFGVVTLSILKIKI